MTKLGTDARSQAQVDALINVAIRYKLGRGRRNVFNSPVDEGVAKMIIERSYNAWLVYSGARAQVEEGGHFSGKEECRRFLETLDSSNVDAFVKLLNQRIEFRSPEERECIDNLQPNSQTQRKKRRVEAASGDFPADSNCEKSRANEILTPSMSLWSRQQTTIQASNEMRWGLFSDASLEATISLFPQFLAHAVERRSHPSGTDLMVAAIDMQLPIRCHSQGLGCSMLICVLGKAVFRLARDLFDVHMEQDASGVYVAHSGDGKLRPHPSLKLEGGCIDVIPTLFGEQMHQAIRSSDCFQEDLRRRHNKTAAITMTIDTLQGTRGRLSLSLGVVDGGVIRSQLYV